MRPILAAVAVAAVLPAGGAGAQVRAPDIGVCAGFPAGAERYGCRCESGAASGAVWGSGPYTADSHVCTAARHAGVIGAAGGVVVATAGPETDRFAGTVANGVETYPWSARSPTFTFLGGAPAAAAAPATCARLPAGVDLLDCICPAAGGAGGLAWGSGPYTSDSDICTAARHAGAIGAGAGPVRVIALRGLPAYTGSTRNGITTTDYPSWSVSITFDLNAR